MTRDVALLTSTIKLLAAEVDAALPVTSWQHIDEHTVLPPLANLDRLLLQAEQALAGCGRDAAKSVAAMLLGCYPTAKAHDPDAYVRGVVSVLQDLPLDIAWQAIDVVTRKVKFLPTRAELHEAAQELLAPRLAMRDLLRAARREAQRRAARPPEPERARLDPETAAERFAEIKKIIAGAGRGVVDND